MDERINKLEAMLNENNGYQLWSNVLPVALSVICGNNVSASRQVMCSVEGVMPHTAI